ncbi:DUF2490 domain-containing protein [Flammeovirga pacifica]|uniref:DUF2490 domain-containing protein n=1 Tax=Flammeovirga pacifica TaxID=915059 RepID=A0A1S1Z3S5_FLAPC|nr:DUF2490 domain-containing protein [Flammeovirga pacifica]OHX67877.1 hypothetical protein NH26_16800 [Flammeovirga pacifica]
MFTFKKPFFNLIFLLSFVASTVQSQDKHPVTKDVINQQLWLDVYFHVQTSDRLNWLFDFGYETIFNDNYWNKIYHETSVKYNLSKTFDVKGGVAFYYHFNSSIDNRFELRPWQALVIKLIKTEFYSLNFQLKNEQRLSWLMDSKTYNFDFRLRSKVFGSFTPFKSHREVYLPFVAEYYYPIKDEIPEVFHNVSKIGMGIGKRFNKHLDASFMANWQYSRSGPNDEYKVSDFAYQFQLTKFF